MESAAAATATTTTTTTTTSTSTPRRSSSSSSSRRRSFPHLDRLNIAPLSQNFQPLILDTDNTNTDPLSSDVAVAVSSPTSSAYPQHSSYIQGKSAPTTPGILSLSRSSSRRRRVAAAKHAYVHDSYFPPPLSSGTDAAGYDIMKKAKSSSALLSPPAGSARRGGTNSNATAAAAAAARPFVRVLYTTSTASPLTSSKMKPSRSTQPSSTFTDDSWLHRAGLAIASEARDTKGQGWLARRASSTSLESPALLLPKVATEPALAVSQRVAAADDPPTPRWPSRVGSRAHSRAHSRRGSHGPTGLTPFSATAASAAAKAAASSSSASNTAYPFYEEALALEEQEDEAEAHRERAEDDEAEAEIAALAASSRSFVGLAWLDRLVGGWTLFPRRPPSSSTPAYSTRDRWANDYDYESSSSSDDDEGQEQDDEELGGDRGRAIAATARDGEALRDMEREVMRRRRAMDAEALQELRVNVAGSADGEAEGGGEEKSQEGGRGGRGQDEVPAWRDAAWLLGVAARVIFS